MYVQFLSVCSILLCVLSGVKSTDLMKVVNNAFTEAHNKSLKQVKKPVDRADISRAASMHCSFLQPNGKSKLAEQKGMNLIAATKKIMDGVMDPNPETVKKLTRIHISRMENFPQPTPILCNELAFYRHIDGTCNNLWKTEWGSAQFPFRRILPPVYEDVTVPRTFSVNGGFLLPSPRLVSRRVHETLKIDDNQHTHLLMQWGQFLDHDIVLTPITTDSNNEALDCGECDSASTVHSECMPIFIPRGDKVFPDNTCFTFARSIPGQRCFGAREQINQVTGFLDASNVYGSDEATARTLRTFHGGQMIGQEVNGQTLLPRNTHFPECHADPGLSCFLAGDERNSEQPGLSSMHTLWLWYHNKVAHRLENINPTWSDEWLYLETRRIVGALHQHITYNEFLRIVFGDELLNLKQLAPRHQGYTFSYDQNCNPTTSNEFATAAFRFGHSLINGLFKVMNDSSQKNFVLKDSFFDPTILYKSSSSITNILRGFVNQAAQGTDRFLDDSVRNHLFEDLDLAALNIQRGRDHAIQPWTAYRKHFQLFVPKDFDELIFLTDSDTRDALRSVYSSVDDIDLFTGILIENKVPGAMLGETGLAILIDHFQRLKFCDRYFYEHGNQISTFTLDQLNSIRSIRLCDVFCELMNLNEMQEHAFLMPDTNRNKMNTCDGYRSIDINLWLDW